MRDGRGIAIGRSRGLTAHGYHHRIRSPRKTWSQLRWIKVNCDQKKFPPVEHAAIGRSNAPRSKNGPNSPGREAGAPSGTSNQGKSNQIKPAQGCKKVGGWEINDWGVERLNELRPRGGKLETPDVVTHHQEGVGRGSGPLTTWARSHYTDD